MSNYVYQGQEVELTGRVAKRKKAGRGRTHNVTFDELVEIKPVNEIESSWKKWVNHSELYEISE
jgi:hypothetical protein